MSRFLGMAAAMLAFAVAVSSPAYAQTLYGSMVGTVLDQSGASVPNVSITITNKGTNQAVETKTDEAGRFSVPNLLPGTYDLKADGFRLSSLQSYEHRHNREHHRASRSPTGARRDDGADNRTGRGCTNPDRQSRHAHDDYVAGNRADATYLAIEIIRA